MNQEANLRLEEDLVILISDDDESNEKLKNPSQNNSNEEDLIELYTVHQNPRKFTTYYNDDELKDVSAFRKRWNIKLKANPNENLSMSNHKSRLNKARVDLIKTPNRQFKSYFSFQEIESRNDSSEPINPNEIDALTTMHPSNRNMNLCLLPKLETDNIRKEELIYDSFYANSNYFKVKNHAQLRKNDANSQQLAATNDFIRKSSFKNKNYRMNTNDSRPNTSNNTTNLKRKQDSNNYSINIDGFSKRPRYH